MVAPPSPLGPRVIDEVNSSKSPRWHLFLQSNHMVTGPWVFLVGVGWLCCDSDQDSGLLRFGSIGSAWLWLSNRRCGPSLLTQKGCSKVLSDSPLRHGGRLSPGCFVGKGSLVEHHGSLKLRLGKQLTG